MKSTLKTRSIAPLIAIVAALLVALPASAGPGSGIADGQVRRAGGPQLGDNIINLDGTGQTVGGNQARRYRAGAVRWFYVYVYNDSIEADTFTIAASEPTGVRPTLFPSPFFVEYFRPTGEDITVAVDQGTFLTPSVAPTERYAIRVKVTVTSFATHGDELNLLFTMSPSNSGFFKDAVGIRMLKK